MANGLENIKEEIDQIEDLEQHIEDLGLNNDEELEDAFESDTEKLEEDLDQNDTGVHEDLAVTDDGLHPLERQWCMWFMNGSKPKNDSKKGGHQNNGWNQGLIELANFGTIEEF